MIVTTPNAEYNVKFETLPAGQFRHPDHRFEWTREEFADWAGGIADAIRLHRALRRHRRRRSTRRAADADGGLPRRAEPWKIKIPELALVVLVGPSGSGKSTFARRHFKPTEIMSSDFCRGLVADDENDQAATKDAFEVLHFIAGKRLAAGRLTVIDATNVQPEARKPLVALARQYHCLPVAIVLDMPERSARSATQARADRAFGPHVIRNQRSQLRRRSAGWSAKGSATSTCSARPRSSTALTIKREPLWNNKKTRATGRSTSSATCTAARRDARAAGAARLRIALTRRPLRVTHPQGARLVFVGDLVDRGPTIAGRAPARDATWSTPARRFCVAGNHDVKLSRSCAGAT